MSIFVSGASGQLGQLVVDHLLEQGHAVVAGSRDPGKLAPLSARGVKTRRFDYTNADSVRSALQGVDRALFISSDTVGHRRDPQVAAVATAAEVGVRHLVYTSIVSADQPSMAVSEDHRATEQAIAKHFESYSILRNNLYAELVLGAVAPALASGTLYTAREEGRISWVSRDDCARAAMTALTDGFDGARTLDITGPQALSGDEMAAVFAGLSGKAVTHTSLPAAAMIEGITSSGLPRPLAEMLVGFDRSAAAGLLGNASPDLENLIGRRGTELRTVLEGARAAWS
ncbi:MAG: NAD(P)H-binding protein [Nannocystaceae bacterium]|nr:NAD(P)H-binding protein [Nannocystaceae bacterium]